MDRNAGSGFAVGLRSGCRRLADRLSKGRDRKCKGDKNNNEEFHCDKAIPFAGSESDQVLDATSTTGLRRKLTSREIGGNTRKKGRVAGNYRATHNLRNAPVRLSGRRAGSRRRSFAKPGCVQSGRGSAGEK